MDSFPEESPPDLLESFLPKQIFVILEIDPMFSEEPGYQGMAAVDQ